MMYQPRQILAYTTITFFLIFVLFYGVADSILRLYPQGMSSAWGPLNYLENLRGGALSIPDFSCYEELDTISSNDFPLDDPERQVIFVGDIHGMMKPLKKLLKRVNYSPSKDVLIHVGDVVTKGPHEGSLAVMNFLASNNIRGVRGNHDQQVVEWRGWLNWISSLSGGRRWLECLEQSWSDAQTEDDDISLDYWINKERSERRPADKKWWKLIPSGWVLFSDHYKIAREMSEAEFKYFLGLPLRLYVPSAHLFVVHGGLLPSNPQYPLDDKKTQPMARLPMLSRKFPGTVRGVKTVETLQDEVHENPHSSGSHKSVDALRNLQEIGLLTQIPQNMDPWVVLNMRSIVDGEISKVSQEGTPWTDLWKKQMRSCVGFNKENVSDGEDLSNSTVTTRKRKGKKYSLPCHPSTIVYGHAASRGLDTKRWSFGLDSGCVYGRTLSALVIGGNDRKRHSVFNILSFGGGNDDSERSQDADDSEDDDDDSGSMGDGSIDASRNKGLRFGDHARAKVVTVGC